MSLIDYCYQELNNFNNCEWKNHQKVSSCNKLLHRLWNLSPFGITSLHFLSLDSAASFCHCHLWSFYLAEETVIITVPFALASGNKELGDYHIVLQLFAWMFLSKLDWELWKQGQCSHLCSYLLVLVILAANYGWMNAHLCTEYQC